jgi:hypothetical protein
MDEDGTKSEPGQQPISLTRPWSTMTATDHSGTDNDGAHRNEQEMDQQPEPGSPPTNLTGVRSSSCCRQTVNQFVLVSDSPLEPLIRFYLVLLFSFDSYFILFPMASSLTRKWVCCLQCLHWLVRSLTTNNHTLPSHLRLCSLSVASYDSQGLRWRYSNSPPHREPTWPNLMPETGSTLPVSRAQPKGGRRCYAPRWLARRQVAWRLALGVKLLCGIFPTNIWNENWIPEQKKNI